MDFEKSMKFTNKKRTLCEVIRECNDIIDGISESKQTRQLRNKFEEIHNMAKAMTKRLYEYSKEWDADFWKDNPDYEKDLKRRLK